jgi:zinc transport system substrate-binding protein
VVASFYPLAVAAGEVGGSRVRVADLTPPGVEPHDLELTTNQVDSILDADLVVYLGGGFQPAVEDALAMREGPSVDALAAVTDPDDRDDPHVWLDPVRMQHLVGAIEHALADLDPPGAAEHADNADLFTSRLTVLNVTYAQQLEDCERDLIVTAHDAFGRLAARYGLRVESIAGISPEAEPSPQRLDELVELVEREGVTTIFTEELVSPEVAETLAREVGVKTAVLSPVEGLSDEQQREGLDYVGVMETNLAALTEALGCR